MEKVRFEKTGLMADVEEHPDLNADYIEEVEDTEYGGIWNMYEDVPDAYYLDIISDVYQVDRETDTVLQVYTRGNGAFLWDCGNEGTAVIMWKIITGFIHMDKKVG